MKNDTLRNILIISFLLCSLSNNAFAVPVPENPKTNDGQKSSTLLKQTHKKNIFQKHPDELKSEQIQDTEKNIKEPANAAKTVTQDKIDSYQEIRDQAKLLYNANKSDDAVKLFNSIPDSEKVSDDWLILANISQDKDKIVDAVFYLKKAIQADDKNYKAHYNLGNLYYYDKKYNMALNEYRKVLRIKKDFAYAYYNKGCCYLKKKSWFNAKYEFGLAIKANPDEPSFYYNLAYTYKMMKKDKKAKEALEMYNKLMTR